MNPKIHTHPYLYRMSDSDGLVYIGSTNRLWRRMEEHRRDKWWARDVINVHASLHPTLADARVAEKLAIYTERPRWNLGDLRPQLRTYNEAEWDDYLRRYVTYRRREAQFLDGIALPHRTGALGIDWLLRRYRFHFGHDYDRSRLELDYQVAA